MSKKFLRNLSVKGAGGVCKVHISQFLCNLVGLLDGEADRQMERREQMRRGAGVSNCLHPISACASLLYLY